MNTIVDVLVCTAALPAILAVFRFGRSTWWKTPAGRVVMAFIGTVAAVLTLAIVSIFLGASYPGRDAVRLAVWLVINAMMWYVFVAMLKIQKNGNGKRDGQVPESDSRRAGNSLGGLSDSAWNRLRWKRRGDR